jgi:hypothetical protein
MRWSVAMEPVTAIRTARTHSCEELKGAREALFARVAVGDGDDSSRYRAGRVL